MCAKSEALKRANKRITMLNDSYNEMYEEQLDLLSALIHIKETTMDIETMEYARLVLSDYWSTKH